MPKMRLPPTGKENRTISLNPYAARSTIGKENM
jgi:hypothetical protein